MKRWRILLYGTLITSAGGANNRDDPWVYRYVYCPCATLRLTDHAQLALASMSATCNGMACKRNEHSPLCIGP